MNTEIVARCVDCGSGFTKTEIQNINCCPRCESTGLPMSPKDDVSIKINWHELRIVVMWAENWANSKNKEMLNTVYAIAQRLQEQHVGKDSLTLSGEMQQLRDAGYDIETRGIPEKETPLYPPVSNEGEMNV